MQAGTTPKKRTSLNGRAALKLMRLDGARRADQAASDARVTKASSSIAVALLLISSGASATECQSSPGHDGKWWSYRIVDSKRCWYQGRPGRSKDLLHWAKQSPPPVVTRPDPGDSPPPAPPVPPQQPTETVDKHRRWSRPCRSRRRRARRRRWPRPRRLCPSRRHCQPSRRSRRSGGCCS